MAPGRVRGMARGWVHPPRGGTGARSIRWWSGASGRGRIRGRRSGRDGVTVWHLLTHTSGLRPPLPLYRDAADSAAALRLVYAASPEVAPGTRVTYSDLNAILLGEIVRRAAGEPLDVFAEREVLGPLELRQTMFRPAARLRPRIAPTGVWRGHPVAGVVNDRNAARLGGVAGHAGDRKSTR